MPWERKKGKRIVAAPLSLMMLALLVLPPISARADQTVYVTATGKHYHSTRSCRGLNRARSVYETTLSNAQSRGLTPCSLCCGGAYTPSNTITQNTQQAEAPTQTEVAQTPDLSPAAQSDTTVSLGQFIKITGVKKAKDGSWITLRLKNVSKGGSLY